MPEVCYEVPFLAQHPKPVEAANEHVIWQQLKRALRDLQTKLTKAQRHTNDAHVLVHMEVNKECE